MVDKKEWKSLLFYLTRPSNLCLYSTQKACTTFTYCRHIYDVIVHVGMHILQLGSELAILQPTFESKAVARQTVSETKKCKRYSCSAESCCLIWKISTLKATEILSKCFFMALLCFQGSSPALDMCQCHSNMSGCVIVTLF